MRASLGRFPALLPVLLAGCALVAPSRALGQGWMHWPVDRDTSSRSWVTQGYYGDYIAYCGGRGSCGTHNGYDYGVAVGTPLYAVAPGVVDAIHELDDRSAEYGRAGLWVRVRYDATTTPGVGGTYYVAYLHLSRIDVAVGAPVDTTTVVGLSGNTGGVAAHLHMHVSTDGAYCGAPVDPGCPTPDWVGGSVIPGFADAPGCQGVCMGVPILWVQPARYGGEPYLGASACMDLDYAGRCEGELLRWCMDGAPLSHDCAADGRVCGYQDDAIGYNCLDCARLGVARCDHGRWLSCDTGAITATDCASLGMICGAAGCEPPPVSELDAAPPDPDAGTALDAGVVPPGTDAGTRPGADGGVAGSGDAGARAGAPSGDAGCGCVVESARSRAPAGLALAVGACALLAARRRRRRGRARLGV